MAWIESHQSLGTHRKLLALCERLHISDYAAVGLLQFLWWWALDNAPDGDITGVSDKVIARASHWRGRPIVWVDALEGCQWVVNQDGKRYLKNWEEYAGKLIASREANRLRQQQYRERQSNGNITVTSQLRNGATVPNSTQPNSIVPLQPPVVPLERGTFKKSRRDNSGKPSDDPDKFTKGKYSNQIIRFKCPECRGNNIEIIDDEWRHCTDCDYRWVRKKAIPP